MAHEVETMAFAGRVPWHSLGDRVDPNASVDDMLRAAGLDWEVKRLPLFAQLESGKLIKMPQRRALVRSSDNRVLSVIGDLWKPLQNKDALEFFREYTESGGATLETAGSLRQGKLIWALASIAKGFTIGRRDHVKGYILLISPHEAGKAITVRTTTVRVVCANTMAMAVNGSVAQYSQDHLSRFDAASAKARIGLAREQVEQAHLDAQALSQLAMSEFDSLRFLATFFQPKPADMPEKAFVKQLLEEPNTRTKQMEGVMTSLYKAPGADPGTAWGVLNAVTHWTDHVAGYKPEARLYNAWLGRTAKLKNEVQARLLELV